MRRALGGLGVLWLSACSVDLAGPAGHPCNAEHPCPVPLSCSVAQGVCVDGDGGLTQVTPERDDAGVRWTQVLEGFSGQSAGTGCSVNYAAPGNALHSVVVGPSPNNFASAQVLRAELPQLTQGRIGGHFKPGQPYGGQSFGLFELLDSQGNSLVALSVHSPNEAVLNSSAGTLSRDGVFQGPASDSFPNLAPLFGTEDLTVEVAWSRGNSIVLYVNGKHAFDQDLPAPTGSADATPHSLQLGLTDFSGHAPDGGFSADFTHWKMSGDPDADLGL